MISMLHAVRLFYCIRSDVLPIIKTWKCCIRPVSKEMLSGFLWLRTCIIEGISVSLHQYSSGILDCGQNSLIEKHGILPGTHCSNLASILCLTYWPSTCIILSSFINTQGYGSLIRVVCLLDILSDWQESAGIGWCVFWGITAVASVVIGYFLYHYCNTGTIFADAVYMLLFNWHAVNYGLCFVCICMYTCMRLSWWNMLM